MEVSEGRARRLNATVKAEIASVRKGFSIYKIKSSKEWPPERRESDLY